MVRVVGVEPTKPYGNWVTASPNSPTLAYPQKNRMSFLRVQIKSLVVKNFAEFIL